MDITLEIERMKRFRDMTQKSLEGLRTVITERQRFSEWGVAAATAGLFSVLSLLDKLPKLSTIAPEHLPWFIRIICILFLGTIVIAVVYHNMANQINSIITNLVSLNNEFYDLELARKEESSVPNADSDVQRERLRSDLAKNEQSRSAKIAASRHLVNAQYAMFLAAYSGMVILLF